MKKITAFLLMWTLLIPTFCISAAETGETPLYVSLFICEEDELIWNGEAVPLGNGLLITSPACVPEGNKSLAFSDDSGIWLASDIFFDRTGTAAFLWYDPEDENLPDYGLIDLVPEERVLNANDLYCLTTNEAGDTLNRALTGISPLEWNGMSCLIVTLTGPAAFGSPILTDGGQTAGMILAGWAEGKNRYLALTAAEIVRRLTDVAVPEEEEFQDSREEGFEVSLEGNLASFDWSGVKARSPEGEEKLYLIVADSRNGYIIYEDTAGETGSKMLLTPGRTYVAGLLYSGTAPDRLPEKYAVIRVPEAEPLTDYDFRNAETVLTAGDEVLTEISAEMLKQKEIALRFSCVYTIETSAEDTLLISFLFPDGQEYSYASGWLWGREYMENDVSTVSLRECGLPEEFTNGNAEPGKYRITWYVGGRLADEMSFEIK